MKGSKRIRRRFTFGIFLLAVIALFLLLNGRIRPLLESLAAEQVRLLATEAMSEAVQEALQQQDLNASLFETTVSSGGVYVMQANSARLNAFAARCADNAKAKITAAGRQGVHLSWGTASGISLFNGLGPSFQLQFSPVGSVKPRCESSFSSAGINQTLHRITLWLEASVQITLPGMPETVKLQTGWPVAESIIVGMVPDAYTNVANEEDLLNLIPESD